MKNVDRINMNQKSAAATTKTRNTVIEFNLLSGSTACQNILSKHDEVVKIRGDLPDDDGTGG